MRRLLAGWVVALAASCGLLSAGVSAGVTAAPASAAEGAQAIAADDAEQALAEKFAPVVSLVHQDVECGPGEPYQPSDVDLVLGDPSVALRGAWAEDDMIQAGPTAEDLGEGLFGYHLDFPGNPLEAGCDYEEWARAAGAGLPPTTYAHVATEVGVDDRLALQYWFFYPFNDYTNKHEGDWEMVQLVFAAADATQAIDQTPLEIGYSQHEGLEVADWDDPKLDIVDGSHPVVNAAAGSHANYFDSALHLGTSGEQGFGCDDTRGPADDVNPAVAVIPGDPAAAQAEFPWIAFQGRWGQREEAFYNGPTGPNTKESWTHPISYQDQKGRDVSYAVPAGGLLGTSATDFFCSTVSSGSEVVRKLADHPGRLLLIAGTDRAVRDLAPPPHHLDTGHAPAHRPTQGHRTGDPRRGAHVPIAVALVHRDRVPDRPGLPRRGRAAEPDPRDPRGRGCFRGGRGRRPPRHPGGAGELLPPRDEHPAGAGGHHPRPR